MKLYKDKEWEPVGFSELNKIWNSMKHKTELVAKDELVSSHLSALTELQFCKIGLVQLYTVKSPDNDSSPEKTIKAN